MSQLKSLDMVRRRPWQRRVAITIGSLLLIAVLCLWLVPWQQTIPGSGEVIVYNAENRIQTIEAQIPGRLVSWSVQEGDVVREGDVIATITDIDSKFLNAEQPKLLRSQLDQARRTTTEAESRVRELQNQQNNLLSAQQNALAVARQSIKQFEDRKVVSYNALLQARQGLKLADQVAREAANQRKMQFQDRVRQANQSVTEAKQQLDTMRLRYERRSGLYKDGLISKQDLEFAENDLVKASTAVERATDQLSIAKRDVNIGSLEQDRATIELDRAKATVRQAESNYEIANRDVVNANLNLARLMADTSAQVSSVGASIQSARESVAKNTGDAQKVAIDLGNLESRTGQQLIRAPRTGRIQRLLKVGPGQTVKAGDELAVIAPTTEDRQVELMISDNDIPWVQVGRPVRLQFAGFPAVQFPGLPGVAIGTFGGRVSVIDMVDDGTGRFRVIIKPDRQTLATGRQDGPWPDARTLRPGAEVVGWVMLDSVPLGFELWRQFNGFPPRLPQDKFGKTFGGKSSLVDSKEYEKKEKDKSLGYIKLKSK